MRFRLIILAGLLLPVVACAPRGLSSGNPLPAIDVAGWTNGDPPQVDAWRGQVVVLSVFGSW